VSAGVVGEGRTYGTNQRVLHDAVLHLLSSTLSFSAVNSPSTPHLLLRIMPALEIRCSCASCSSIKSCRSWNRYNSIARLQDRPIHNSTSFPLDPSALFYLSQAVTDEHSPTNLDGSDEDVASEIWVRSTLRFIHNAAAPLLYLPTASVISTEASTTDASQNSPSFPLNRDCSPHLSDVAEEEGREVAGAVVVAGKEIDLATIDISALAKSLSTSLFPEEIMKPLLEGANTRRNVLVDLPVDLLTSFIRRSCSIPLPRSRTDAVQHQRQPAFSC
jgi:hypothetical protein